MNEEIHIRTTLKPGDLGRLIAFHGEIYADDPVHFGPGFEAHVARTVADFVLNNDSDGRVWLAEQEGRLVGCAAMVARGDRGQLRWVLLTPEMRGQGLGKKLVLMALDYAAQRGWQEVFLETTPGLDASMGIYRKLGFEVDKEQVEKLWGIDTTVIYMTKKLP